jgi:hypothetical protein
VAFARAWHVAFDRGRAEIPRAATARDTLRAGQTATARDSYNPGVLTGNRLEVFAAQVNSQQIVLFRHADSRSALTCYTRRNRYNNLDKLCAIWEISLVEPFRAATGFGFSTRHDV